jgi:hypothetical protein
MLTRVEFVETDAIFSEARKELGFDAPTTKDRSADE